MWSAENITFSLWKHQEDQSNFAGQVEWIWRSDSEQQRNGEHGEKQFERPETPQP